METTLYEKFFSRHQAEVERARLARRRFEDVDVVDSDVNIFNLLISNLLTTIKKYFLNRPCVMILQVNELFSRKSWPGHS